MAFFGRKPPLDESPKLSPTDYLCKLTEETNALLRELLLVSGKNPMTPSAKLGPPKRQYTQQDVSTVTLTQRRRMAQEQAADAAAPWRHATPDDGPASGTMPRSRGLTRDGVSGAGSPASVEPIPDAPPPKAAT